MRVCLSACMYGRLMVHRRGNEGILRESGLEEERIEEVVSEVTG